MKPAAIRFLVLVLITAPQFAAAQQQPAPAMRPTNGISVREWLILVSDPFQAHASAATLFRDALPDFIESRRPRATGAQRTRPMPVGVIRVTAPAQMKLDVQLDARNGQFLSSWPVARMRGNAAIWRDITIQQNPRNLVAVDEQHWLSALRRPGRPYLFTGDRSEGFLLYDVTLPFAAQVSLAQGSDRDMVRLAHAGYSSLHDLVFYRPDGANGWQTAAMPDLAAPAGAVPPPVVIPRSLTTAQQQAESQRELTLRQQIASIEASRQSILMQIAQQGLDPAAAQSILQRYETQLQTYQSQLPKPLAPPTVNPAAAAEKPGAAEVQLTRAASADLPALLAEWKQRLAAYDLEEADLNVILQILRTQIEDSARLTAIYRMDDAELHRLLPMEVVPTPGDIRRVALVIVKNIDPGLPAEIDALVQRLGDNDWKTRESASRSLAAIGPAARAKLMSALTHRDAEIALRAERLLGFLNAQQTPQTGARANQPAPAPVFWIAQ